MKILNVTYKLLIFIVIFSSCDGKELGMEEFIKDKENPVEYIIEGQISNIVRKQYVFISKPGSINGNSQYKGVSKAVVQVSDGATIWKFKELPKNSKKYDDLFLSKTPYLANAGIYESESYFTGKEGKTYTLKVVVEGQEFTAKETMPKTEKMTEDEFKSLQSTTEFSRYIFSAEKNAIWTSSSSNQLSNALLDKENVKILILGRINSLKYSYNIDGLESKTSENHILKSYSNEVQFNTLRRYTPTKEFSNYIWTYILGRGGNSFALEQNTHPSNFNSKKVAGYFSVINGSQYKTNENTYYKEFISYLTKNEIYTANYTDKGTFKLTLNADGSCQLKGLEETLLGAYDIINDKQLRVYFSREYAKPYQGLYHFYEVELKKALVFKKEKPEDKFSYWSGYNAIFNIENDGSIKTQDGVVWKVK